MPDRHDDVDAWLSERIDPLPPPPGTFDLIKRRARRRQYRRLAITATSAGGVVGPGGARPEGGQPADAEPEPYVEPGRRRRAADLPRAGHPERRDEWGSGPVG